MNSLGDDRTLGDTPRVFLADELPGMRRIGAPASVAALPSPSLWGDYIYIYIPERRDACADFIDDQLAGSFHRQMEGERNGETYGPSPQGGGS